MDSHSPYQPYQNPRRSQRMEQASLFLGITGIIGICIIYPTLICAPLAIVFSLLSRGGEMKLADRSKIGLALGIVSLVIVAILFVMAFAMLISYYGSIFNIPVDASGNPVIDYNGITEYLLGITAK